jgi:hypothetical protein
MKPHKYGTSTEHNDCNGDPLRVGDVVVFVRHNKVMQGVVMRGSSKSICVLGMGWFETKILNEFNEKIWPVPSSYDIFRLIIRHLWDSDRIIRWPESADPMIRRWFELKA